MKSKEITKTWISGQSSCTLIIPKSVAREYGLVEPSHVIVQGTPEGILIRKLEF
jgi:bifunctional DNA-binding transcriptional regulator/antitoxin component of YhaV-PrlF toxin-antitoxin module